MKTVLAVLFLVLATSSADASISSNWSGSVDYSATEGDWQGSDSWGCEFALTKQGKYLYVSDPDWCTYLDTRYEIVGNDLFIDGTPIGTISENSVNFLYESGSTKWALDITINDDGSMKLHETFTKPKRCGHMYSDVTDGTFDVDSKKATHKKSGKKHKTERVR